MQNDDIHYLEKVSDAEKVLIFFQKASEYDMKIEEEYVDSYIYILKSRGIYFDYEFIFQPLPYSKELRRDIMALKMAGYLSGGSITITSKGKNYIKMKQTTLGYFRELIEEIGKIIKSFIGLSKKQLLDAIYARIV